MDLLVFIRLARQEDADTNKANHLLFKCLNPGKIDKYKWPCLTNTYLFCLYKDEKDPIKLRHIGVPTALRRIITNHITQTFCRKFACHLLSYDSMVGIDNGMDFVPKASQLAVEKYITRKGRNG